ncbi:MAG: hypothetical protein D6771_07335 [Zetaproteobacteria bacterium]|nr:MAG: hypothetical protein D6771_07335 [Zetaproteobacteria bacterium]
MEIGDGEIRVRLADDEQARMRAAWQALEAVLAHAGFPENEIRRAAAIGMLAAAGSARSAENPMAGLRLLALLGSAQGALKGERWMRPTRRRTTMHGSRATSRCGLPKKRAARAMTQTRHRAKKVHEAASAERSSRWR